MKKDVNNLKSFVQRKKRSKMFQCEIYLSHPVHVHCPSIVFSKITWHIAHRLNKPKKFLIKIFKPNEFSTLKMFQIKWIPKRHDLNELEYYWKRETWNRSFNRPKNMCANAFILKKKKKKKNYGGMFENIWKASNWTANTTDTVALLYVSFLWTANKRYIELFKVPLHV